MEDDELAETVSVDRLYKSLCSYLNFPQLGPSGLTKYMSPLEGNATPNPFCQPVSEIRAI